jgi:hypothetical protein
MVTIEILQSCSGVDFSYHQGQRVEVAPERAADLVKHQSAKYPDPVSEAEQLRIKTEQEAAQALIDEQRRELDEKQAEFDRQMADFAEQQRQFLDAQAAAEVATVPAPGETATTTPADAETTVETTPPGQQTATAPKGATKPAATKPS